MRKVALVVLFLGFVFSSAVLADDPWYVDYFEAVKGVAAKTEYDISINTRYHNNSDAIISDLRKRAGLRLNYRFGESNFLLTSGKLQPRFFTDVLDRRTGEAISPGRVDFYYLSCKYLVWEGIEHKHNRIYAEGGIAQGRFKLGRLSGLGIGVNDQNRRFRQKEYMPFLGAGVDISVSRNSLFALEVWHYLGSSEFKINELGNRYSFRQDKTQMMFSVIYRF